MNYKLWICNLITGDFEYVDISYFNKSTLAFNMAYKWAWNDNDRQRRNVDGECCYIEY